METLFKLLEKYEKKIKLKKLPVYQFCQEHKSILGKYHFPYLNKNEIELEKSKAVIQSLINKEKIDTIYQDYCNEQYYIFDALDYRQLNNLIYQEIMTKLETIPHFYNPDLIVVPTLDASLNKMLIQDYQYVTLKYGEQKIADGFKQQLDPFEQYGFYGYHFTDLQYINHFDHIYYFYLDQTKKIYLFDQQQKKFISQFPICDKDYFDKVEVDHNLLIEIVELAQTEYPVEFLSSMFLMNLITEKTYRAILSKVGNH